MPNRKHQDYLAVSEDFSLVPSGLLYSDNLHAVDDWYIPHRTALPLTPPDSTASDCAFSDCLDMDASQWKSSFGPEDWCSQDALLDQDLSSHMDLPAFANPTQGQIDAIQVWTSHTHGSVDTDMSPSLSYTSQSSQSLNTFSDSEHLWTNSVTLPSSMSMARHASASSTSYPQFLPHGQSLPQGNAGKPGRQERHVNDVALPHYPPERSVNWMSSGQSMDNTHQPSHAIMNHDRANNGTWLMYQTDEAPFCIASHAPRTQKYGHALTGRSKELAVVDPIAEDFSTLIDFPVEEQQYTTEDQVVLTNVGQPWPVGTSKQPSAYNDTDFLVPLAMDMVAPRSRTSPRTNFMANGVDAEDGRYRTDALYTRNPEADGLYHCPFAQSENCGHGPTKLKCNYDKFIDSHLKPFRCKIAECAKQAFSSTACLLRHEREAHGMHGHGKCPHLCPVPGCERSEPGKGFPRLYNCKDHQRRAHGIVSSPSSSLVAGVVPQSRQSSLATGVGPQSKQSKPSSARAGSARKRKASPTERTALRRHKHDSTEEDRETVHATHHGNQRTITRSTPIFDAYTRG